MTSNLDTVLIYGGSFLILYSVLKSWGVITTPASIQQQQALLNWKPLTEQELNQLRVERLENPSDVYKDGEFYRRTGRDRNKQFGFVGNL